MTKKEPNAPYYIPQIPDAMPTESLPLRGRGGGGAVRKPPCRAFRSLMSYYYSCSGVNSSTDIHKDYFFGIVKIPGMSHTPPSPPPLGTH